MNDISNDILMHVGVSIKDGAPGRGSGRYPLGSGENPYQHQDDFVGRVKRYREEGKTDKEICEEMGIKTISELKRQYAAYNNDRRLREYVEVKKLHDKGMTNEQIAKELGLAGESTVRGILKNNQAIENAQSARTTADYLKEVLKDNPGKVVDVGLRSGDLIGISDGKLDEALYLLEEEGYHVYPNYKVKNPTNPGYVTTMKVLAEPEVEYKDLYHDKKTGLPVETVMINQSKEKILIDNGNKLVPAFQYPASFDSKRLQVVYDEDGGSEKDGLVELRRGVNDISLGNSNYAQVRILVDGTHYIKGMAVYADDLPEGIDIRFNTNKKRGTPVTDPDPNVKTVLKPINKDDPMNPFNSYIKERGGQYYYIGDDGKEHLSVINKRSDQGDWEEWADKLPAQFLAKQPKKLIKQQLDISIKSKEDELNDILSITNPVVKQERLYAFALACDGAAKDLKAAPLPGQKWHVILPVPDMPDDEIYAPKYENGTQVALVRYPHGGTFEIPILTVNNNRRKAKAMIGSDAEDAVGITKKVADQLSGADFDGDTVMLIPTNDPKGKVNIQSRRSLRGLEGFDPKASYPKRPGMTYLSKENTQREMGIISNLIMDMTLQGATDEELARAVRHSMVVIDANKHSLDYKRSEIENDIDGLKRKYQKNPNNKKGYGGVATLITRAKSEVSVPLRKGSMRIDPETGKVYWNTAPDKERYYEETKPVYKRDEKGKLIKDENGNRIPETRTTPWGKEVPVTEKTGRILERRTKTTRMDITDDAMDLVSGASDKEYLYGEYANKMKALAIKARKAYYDVDPYEYSKSAASMYKDEVDNLMSQLTLARLNKPYERQAQNMANRIIAKYKEDDDSLYKDKEKLRKLKDRVLKDCRKRIGAERVTITISPKQWEAIQARAISKSLLREILEHTDDNVINNYAMPKKNARNVSITTLNRIKAYRASNYTIDQIAKAVGLSPSAVSRLLKEEG